MISLKAIKEGDLNKIRKLINVGLTGYYGYGFKCYLLIHGAKCNRTDLRSNIYTGFAKSRLGCKKCLEDYLKKENE